MKKYTRILLFCSAALMLISWDRATKDLAKEHLKDKAPISYFNDVLRLQYVENTGAALSLGDSLPATVSLWLLSILPMTFLLFLSGYVLKRSNQMNLVKLSAFILIIAGGMGNIFDRIVYDRHVSDFMILGYKNIYTGIFNFADVYVTTGVILLLFSFSKKTRSQLPVDNSFNEQK